MRRLRGRLSDQPAVLSNLGAALIATGAPGEAIPLLQRAVAVAPDIGLAHLLLAGALFDTRRDIHDIVAHARRAVELLPDNSPALLMLARALGARGDLKSADELVTRALILEPANPEARGLLQTIRRLSGRPPR